MKIFKYLITAFAFSIKADPFYLTQENCDYLTDRRYDNRTYFVLATIGIYNAYANNPQNQLTARGVHTLAYNVHNHVQQFHKKGVANGQDLTFADIVNIHYSDVYATLSYSSTSSGMNFWEMDFSVWCDIFNDSTDTVFEEDECTLETIKLSHNPKSDHITKRMLRMLLFTASCFDINIYSSIEIKDLPIKFQENLTIRSLAVIGKPFSNISTNISKYLPKTTKCEKVVFQGFSYIDNLDYISDVLSKTIFDKVKLTFSSGDEYKDIDPDYVDNVCEIVNNCIRGSNIELETVDKRNNGN